ncbi:MAG: hydroxymethylpyrimidine/phosphomethylpyrimidine kinase [Paracoccaceae bacterium]
MTHRPQSAVLAIGGMDSSGGAGLLRDQATIDALGGTMRAAVTCVTAQDDCTVSAIHPVPVETVVAQIERAGPVRAVKIGMLGTSEIVRAVAGALPDVPCVLDPVLASSSGRALLSDRGMDALVAELLPRAMLLTPNLPELRMLSRRLGLEADGDEATCVRTLMRRGCRAVLVKGGHAEPGARCEDRLYLKNGSLRTFGGPRYGFSLRGTGCQIASAIAFTLGQGGDLCAAVDKARSVVMTRFRTHSGEP